MLNSIHKERTIEYKRGCNNGNGEKESCHKKQFGYIMFFQKMFAENIYTDYWPKES